jgi:hypothetical protein
MRGEVDGLETLILRLKDYLHENHRKCAVYFLLLIFLESQNLGLFASNPLSGTEERATSQESRFPSVEEHIKLYMSNRYMSPCNYYDDGHVSFSYHQEKNAN